ncbi:MAG TPA: hypothetical protein DD379_25495 [Cyanobacteria bacterium UBA11162]|nr:hypothetical protein [Cyanobacteria bacterium UBA11162]
MFPLDWFAFMSTPSLKECAETVPVCLQTVSLASVLEIFRSSGSEAIVVVNEEQCPLGVVNLRQIIPHLISLATSAEQPLNGATSNISEPLSQLNPSVIESLPILPASLTVSQFLTYLRGEMGGEGEGVTVCL